MAWPIESQALVGFMALLVCSVVMNLISWRKRADAKLMARHLNRKCPELEESCGLVLKSDESLTGLERLQKLRITAILEKLDGRRFLPKRMIRTALRFSLLVMTVSVIMVMWAPQISSRKEKTEIQPSDVEDQVTPLPEPGDVPPGIVSSTIEIIPPLYTGKSAWETSQFNLLCEEGSEVIWQLKLSQPVKAAQFVFGNLDTINLVRQSPFKYSLRRAIWEPGFYFVYLENQKGISQQSDYFKIEVIEDLPAIVSVISPPLRKYFKPGEKAKMEIKTAAEDDYGVSAAQIIATVTRGSGESVRFREVNIQFAAARKKSKTSVEFIKNLDLNEIGLQPGDEFYFHVRVWDNREPRANLTRSETHFVVLEDSTYAPALVSAGIAINPIPAYFRSQRQIIIDTEKLMEEKHNLSEAEFNKRSNNLGIDQKVLRLRYGQFLGEEFESAYGQPDAFEAERKLLSAEEELRSWEELEPERENAQEEQDVLEEFRHDHDSEENATLFSESIKTQLKAALAEMWDAELKLRTHLPKEALPFEYRALVLLKKVQQRSRAFVQRVGFEPPPLEPDKKRFSGDLAEISDLGEQRTIDQIESFPNMRKSLRILAGVRRGMTNLPSESLVILEKAGQELAAQAMETPGVYIYALQDMREIIKSIIQESGICEDCVFTVERTIWNLLPKAAPVPSRSTSRNSEVAKLYFKKLESR
jgi:hypothetical protein